MPGLFGNSRGGEQAQRLSTAVRNGAPGVRSATTGTRTHTTTDGTAIGSFTRRQLTLKMRPGDPRRNICPGAGIAGMRSHDTNRGHGDTERSHEVSKSIVSRPPSACPQSVVIVGTASTPCRLLRAEVLLVSRRAARAAPYASQPMPCALRERARYPLLREELLAAAKCAQCALEVH